MQRAPVRAPPTMLAGMTRSGSAAANGMAPSEMKDAPSSQAALPFSRSARVKSFLSRTVARAIASGGTMPAAMTVAMICHGAWLVGAAGAQAGYCEGVGNLVDRAAEVEAHHEAKDDAEDHGGGAAHAREPAVQAEVRPAMGPPRTRNIRPEAKMEASSGMIDHGHQAAEPARYLPRPDQVGNVAGQQAARRCRRGSQHP